MDLFDLPSSVVQFRPREHAESPIARTARRIRALLEARHPLALAFSSGKDSSALAALTLSTAASLKREGKVVPPIVVVNSDTGVEQPEIVALAKSELRKMHQFAERHGIPVRTMRGQPLLSDSFAVRVIGGRALPAFPDSRADCSVNWKVDVNARLLAKAQKEFKTGQWSAPVVITGVREDESVARDIRIAKRGEVAEGTWTNDLGQLRASPILDWTVDDVWEYLAQCAAGIELSYSDFQETMRIYRDAGGSSCVIVADMRMQGNSKPCGARTGCWACTRVRNDRSMANMLASDPERYGYLEPLARLRDFIAHTQYDWSRRQFVGRSIDKDGFIAIGADTYNPEMLQNLLRYTLSAQVASGVEIISPEALIAICARWSMYGLCPPFTALKIAQEVQSGQLEFAPVVSYVPKTPVPKLGRIHVGIDWYETTGINATVGLRSPMLELFHESCGVSLRALNNGALIADYEFDQGISIDMEGAMLFLDFEAERHVETYCKPGCQDWTIGYHTYLRYGTIALAKGNSASADAILRRTQWRQAHGLHGQHSPESLCTRPDFEPAVRSGMGDLFDV
jgi:3'-phosphoadenosine 5'-phosphosulfate sulfotransferase (PAPS reductase)/FAD synthetase